MDATPVVLDNGTGFIKAGFAGAATPRAVLPNVVGRSRRPPAGASASAAPRAGAGAGSSAGAAASAGAGSSGGSGKLYAAPEFVGAAAVAKRGVLQLHHPMEHGVVRRPADVAVWSHNWDDLMAVWRHTYGQLGVATSRQPVLVSEAPLNPREHRQRMTHALFEDLDVPAMFVETQAVLALYASGRSTGTVVDCGDGVTHVVPVYDGRIISHAVQRLNVAGRDVTRELARRLHSRGLGFGSSAALEVAREVKEHVSYVAVDLELEAGVDDAAVSKPYELPDGTVIHVGRDRYECPEALFQPSTVGVEAPGVHQAAFRALAACDVHVRKELGANIVLSGGTTLLPGFKERLTTELRKAFVADTAAKLELQNLSKSARMHALTAKGASGAHVKVAAPPERQFSAWLGGSVLASLSSFQSRWVTKAQYDEVGVDVTADDRRE